MNLQFIQYAGTNAQNPLLHRSLALLIDYYFVSLVLPTSRSNPVNYHSTEHQLGFSYIREKNLPL